MSQLSAVSGGMIPASRYNQGPCVGESLRPVTHDYVLVSVFVVSRHVVLRADKRLDCSKYVVSCESDVADR